jgi:hypothetical protein
VLQEIMERRFRWNVRQVIATVAETERALGESSARREAGHVASRLSGLRAFFTAVDVGLGAFTQGKPLDPELLRALPPRVRQRS